MVQAAAAAARFAADTPDNSRAHDFAGDILSPHQASAQKQLAPFGYPRWIEFRDDLPKTATGRIERFKLRAEASMNSSAKFTNRRASAATKPFAEPGKNKTRPVTANGAFLGE